MDISDFVDCVRHELLTAPCVEESEEDEENESENESGDVVKKACSGRGSRDIKTKNCR